MMKENFIFDWIRRNKLLISLITIGICGGIISYYWTWFRPLMLVLAIFLIGFYFIPITGFLKYHLYWDFKEKFIELTLNPIWKKAGIIEIQGGSESGKTLLIILLTKHLKGRKWNNIPNVITGCQYLDLTVLKQHREGNFKEGLTGVNNVLFIDEIWNFFSKKEANKAGVNLSNLLWFLSETSKTGWKVFYVTKQGVRLRKELAILTESKSGIIIVKGHRLVANYWGRKYFCLDISFNGKNIAIPFNDLDLYLFDNAWNAEEEWAKNRTKNFINKLGADQLQRTLGLPSRTQKLKEEMEAEAWGRRNYPDMFHQKNFWEVMRKKGWQPLKEKAKATGINLSPQEIALIEETVSRQHRKGSKLWEKLLEKRINIALLRKSKGENIFPEKVEELISTESSENENKDGNSEELIEPAETNQENLEGNIDMEAIYQRVNKKYHQGSPKWNRAVEKEIDEERKRLGLNIDN